ncbi:hypothetical protein A6F68_02252 [Tsuneonella dongtanensis]|uniref:Uncharacterized protein n=1 Tax=Tsuneonella dongtanensis TaxID=692370 RepID=A0A1B2AF20_9SPHN|nr:hypothetical protein [Tsuneonella dongtanensis]ANY20752.1 hypothetical protein A6F68_02252 [Tsuneonella dongtanensis]
MRSILILSAAAIALAGCSQEAAEPAPAEPAEEVAPAPAAAAGPVVGTEYDATYEDGTKVKFTVNADGTYTASGPDGDVKGAHSVEDGKHCFDPEGDGENLGKMCWTAEAADATGTFKATSDAGVTATSVPVTG